jgi:hypothetical protein
MSEYMSEMQFDNNSNILLQNTLNLFLEQLILLNKKIENLEEKIININCNKYIYKNKPLGADEIDWNCIHLY